jgi:hypothetical protein
MAGGDGKLGRPYETRKFFAAELHWNGGGGGGFGASWWHEFGGGIAGIGNGETAADDFNVAIWQAGE